MTLERLGEILKALDPETEALGTAFQLTVSDVPIVIVTGLSLLIASIACRSLQALPVFRSSDPALAVGPPPDAEGEAKVEQADDAKGGA